MDAHMEENLSPSQEPIAAGEPDALVVALDGFDGPIDLLLSLARDQKVDLGRVSILALAEQYLAFINSARKLRLEVAADYLVMAAWLAYLKSRLLLPEPPADEPAPSDMADALKFQLLRLEAMQKAARALQDLPQLHSDIFLRGLPDKLEVTEKPLYFLPIGDLLSALAAPHRRRKPSGYEIPAAKLYSLQEGVERLRRVLGGVPDWEVIQKFLPEVGLSGGESKDLELRSAMASTFAATLELVKSGEIELRQDGTFAPIYFKQKRRLENGETA